MPTKRTTERTTERTMERAAQASATQSHRRPSRDRKGAAPAARAPTPRKGRPIRFPIGAAPPEPQTILIRWASDGTYSVGIADERAKVDSQPRFSAIHNIKRGLSRHRARAEVRRLRQSWPSIRMVWGESLLEGR